MFVGDVGRRGATSFHVKNLTVQTGGQPAVGASAQSVVLTASHSSFIEVPSTGLQVCVCDKLFGDQLREVNSVGDGVKYRVSH